MDSQIQINLTQFSMIRELAMNYDHLVGYNMNYEKDVIIHSSVSGKCRFCGKTTPNVTFNKRAHAISELCGNHHLLTDYECDSCNAHFSKYEREFSQFMLFYNTVFRVDGKKGVPIFKPYRNGNSQIQDDDGLTDIHTQINEDPIAKFDKKTKSLHVYGSQTYVPIAVYKALLKMALTIMPESEMQYFSDATRSLKDESFSLPNRKQCFLRIFGGPLNVIGSPTAIIYKKRESSNAILPTYLFALAYGNFMFQMYLPGCTLDKSIATTRKFDIPIIPSIADGVFPVIKTTICNLDSIVKVIKEPLELTFSFADINGKWLIPWWKRPLFMIEALYYSIINKIKNKIT